MNLYNTITSDVTPAEDPTATTKISSGPTKLMSQSSDESDQILPPPEKSFSRIFDHKISADEYQAKAFNNKFKLAYLNDDDEDKKRIEKRWKKGVNNDPKCTYSPSGLLLRYLRVGLAKTPWFMKAVKKSWVYHAFEQYVIVHGEEMANNFTHRYLYEYQRQIKEMGTFGGFDAPTDPMEFIDRMHEMGKLVEYSSSANAASSQQDNPMIKNQIPSSILNPNEMKDYKKWEKKKQKCEGYKRVTCC